jgi:hypothetical protein
VPMRQSKNKLSGPAIILPVMQNEFKLLNVNIFGRKFIQ